MQVSNSEIQCYKQCKRRWWLAYFRRLRPVHDTAHGPRAVGNRVHACLAWYYGQEPIALRTKAGKASRAKVSREDFALRLHDWSVELDCAENELEADDVRKEADLSRAMLEGYFEWLAETGADAGHRTVAAEHEVSVEVVTPATHTPVTIRGKLDLLVAREQEKDIVFKDHKTTMSFVASTKTIHLDEQLLMYHLLQTLVDPEHAADGGTYNMLRKVKRTATAKPPFYMRFDVRHSPEEVESFQVRLMGTLEDIVETRRRLEHAEKVKGKKKRDRARLAIVYPTPSHDCSWKCEFFAVCQLVDRPQDKRGEPLIARLYEEGDPYERYVGNDAAADAVA